MVGKSKNFNITEVLKVIKSVTSKLPAPIVAEFSKKNDPFATLISCIISLRTRDNITKIASKQLFDLARSPMQMIKLENKTIEKAIYPAAFYRNKANNIKEICQVLIEKYEGAVPEDLETLLQLKGVGRKTANLTLILGHNKLGICVDVHVHRISNRWGYIKTKTPDETELVLRKILPKRFWKIYNEILVSFGQNVCKPIAPYCSSCLLETQCLKIGVNHHR